jgi:CRP-like cAMP-binding protein
MSSATTNRLLAALSPQARELLLNRAIEVALPTKTRLYEAEETPSHAYFMTSGMASIVISMENGETAEVGIVGSEGLVGGLHILGPGKVSTNSVIQLEATALKIPLSDLRKAFRTSEEIRGRILEFYQEQSVMVSQLAGCNRLHEAEERLSRWLLMAQDRAQSEVLNFTQEFLGMMLGSRRPTVTIIARTLQRAELIEYSRGRVKVIDREGLESAACDCYKIIRELLKNLYTRPLPNDNALDR